MDRNIAITESYLTSVFRLDNQSKKITLNTVKQLATNSNSTSLQIHSIDRLRCDSKFRSARVNDDLRIIFAMQGDTYTLLYIDHHDDAYNWCEGKFIKHTDFGAQYIYDEKVMLTNVEHLASQEYVQFNFEKPLFETVGIKEKNLVKLGVPQIHAQNLLKISNEDAMVDYVTIFPDEIQEALLDLAAGNKSFDMVYNELADNEVCNNEMEILSHKDSKRRFYITQSMEELEVLMENDDFEKWTTFLHSSQDKIVRMNFSGPALIEGGPGTGKTIVGIHRAVYLAENIYRADEGKRILFCTFSKKLAKAISEKLSKLIKQKGVANNIDVVSVDKFFYQIIKDSYETVERVDENGFARLFDNLYGALKPSGSKKFYQYEFHEIIEKFNIKTLEQYLKADRNGTGMPLDAKKRAVVWGFFEKLLEEKKNNKICTFVDRAYKVLDGFSSGKIVPCYDSIIIDEAQDLATVKLKALCQCVRNNTNNVLILSDMNQRIFRLATWKKDGGINVVGRTHYLSVNYRTTKQIKDYAQYQFVHSKMVTSHIKDYKSIVNGVEPQIAGFKTEKEQYQFVVDKTKELLASGYVPNQICIVCPTNDDCNNIEGVLTYGDIKTTKLFNDIIPAVDSGICICPIKGVKGLEFSVVIIFNYNKIEKSLLKDESSAAIRINEMKLVECEKYVAATRARDELIITYLEEEA